MAELHHQSQRSYQQNPDDNVDGMQSCHGKIETEEELRFGRIDENRCVWVVFISESRTGQVMLQSDFLIPFKAFYDQKADGHQHGKDHKYLRQVAIGLLRMIDCD